MLAGSHKQVNVIMLAVCALLLCSLSAWASAQPAKLRVKASKKARGIARIHTYAVPNNAEIMAISRDHRLRACVSQGWPSGSPLHAPLGDGEVCVFYLYRWPSGHVVVRRLIRGQVSFCTFHPGGQSLAVVYNRSETVDIYDTKTGARRALRTGDGGWGAAVFSPDGRTMAVPGSVNTPDYHPVVRLYDTSTWKLRRTLKGFDLGVIVELAFSHSGSLVAAVDGGEGPGGLGVWDARTGQVRLMIDELPSWDGPDSPLRFVEGDRFVRTGPLIYRVGGQ